MSHLKHHHVGDDDIVDEQKSRRRPIIIIGGIFLLLLLVVSYVPLTNIGKYENPSNIPSINDVRSLLPKNISNPGTLDIWDYVVEDSEIKHVSNRIIVDSCSGGDTCYAKALYYFVRDNVQYIPDPNKEYFETPFETILTGGADCDGQAILLASLLQSVGFLTEFVFVPGHVYVRFYSSEIPDIYRAKDNWVYLDTTCKTCEFGEIPKKV